MSSFNIKACVTVTLSVYLSLFSTLCTGSTTTINFFQNCGNTRYVSDDDKFIVKLDGEDWNQDNCEMKFVSLDYYDMLYAETDSMRIDDSDVSLTLKSSSTGSFYLSEKRYSYGYYSSTGKRLMNTYLRITADRRFPSSGSSLDTQIEIYNTDYDVWDYTILSVGSIVGIVIGSVAGLIIFIVIIVVSVKQCNGTRGRVIARGGQTTVLQPIATTVNTHYPTQPLGMTYGYPMTTVPAYSTNTTVVMPTLGQAMPYQPVNPTAGAPTAGVAPLATASTPSAPSDAPPPYPDKY